MTANHPPAGLFGRSARSAQVIAAKIHGPQGLVLPTALLFLAVLALLGTTAVLTTTTDMKIGHAYTLSAQAFYSAQAGCNEARARLCSTAAHRIVDTDPSSSDWKIFIGTLAQARAAGYDPTNSRHTRYDRIAADLDYTVVVTHCTDGHGHVVYWGDADQNGVYERGTVSGKNIYVITSTGHAGGYDTCLRTEAAAVPEITVPSALYLKAPSSIQGGTAYVSGLNACGTGGKHGLITPQAPGSITLTGSPQIEGTGGASADVEYNGPQINVQALVNMLRDGANHRYTGQDLVHGKDDTPGPGDGWGDPILGATSQDPSSCGTGGIVYYDTDGTRVRFTGGVSGCGLLLVDGDLDINGDFTWYGPIILTGTVTIAGGAHITGAVIAGTAGRLDATAGRISIIYCSASVSGHTAANPLQILTWKEMF